MPLPVAPYSSPADFNLADTTTSTQQQNIDAFGNAYVTFGGKQTTAVAAGTTTDTVIKASPGRLCKVLITTSAAAAIVFYDNTSGHTGTIIGYIAASTAVGTVVDLQMPAANGITFAGIASSPAFTVSWS